MTAFLIAGALPGAAARGKPDLVVAAVSAAQEAQQGGRLAVTSKVVNEGTYKAARSTTALLLSKDQKRGADLKLKPLGQAKALAPNAGVRSKTVTTVPATATVGDYYVLACADAGTSVRESNEKNNCRASPAVVTVSPPPSAADLIEQDEAAGAITHEQSLIYKVFENFEDPRLPARYEDAPPETFGDGPLADIQMELETLSAETKAILKPFFIPPFLVGSHWSPVTTAARAQPADDEPWACGTDSIPTSEDWRFIDVAGAPVRIWWQLRYDATDNATASAMASYVPKAYEAVTDLMGREPLSDGGGPCDGGSDHLDIALVDSNTATTYADGLCGTPDSTHMVWPRTTPSNWKHPAPYMAHELTHAIQYGIDTSSGCSEYAWLREATAQWVQDYVTDPSYAIQLPGDESEWEAAPKLLNDPEFPLDQTSPPPGHAYGSYLLFLFAVRTQGLGVVPQIWNATISKNSVDAVDGVISGGFAETWKKFALANWNHGPVKDYKTWDGLALGAKTAGSVNVPIATVRPPLELDHLSATYVELGPEKNVTEIEYRNDKAGNANAHVQSVIYYDDGSYDVKDLSTQETTSLCVDDGTKRATRIILIFSNASKTATESFAPEIEGKDACGCPSATAPRASTTDRATDAMQTCEAKANVTYTFTEVTNDPTYRFNHTGTLSLNVKLRWIPKYHGYYDDGSSFTFSGSGDSWYDRGPNGNCPSGDFHMSTWNDSGSGSWTGLEGPQGSVDHDTDSFFMSAQAYRMTRNQSDTWTCAGSGSTTNEWDPVPSYGCPVDGPLSFSWVFKLQSETNNTATYAIDCQSERDINGLSPGGGPTHVTVTVKGSMTISKP